MSLSLNTHVWGKMLRTYMYVHLYQYANVLFPCISNVGQNVHVYYKLHVFITRKLSLVIHALYVFPLQLRPPQPCVYFFVIDVSFSSVQAGQYYTL